MTEHSQFKVVMMGSSGVGKTALVERISNSDFNDVHVPTIGAQFVSIDFRINNNIVTLDLWDTAGQEVFRSLVGFYARDAKGVFLVADLTSKSTLEELDRWNDFIKDQTDDAKVILFGNKTDLSSDRVIEEGALQEYADNRGFVYMEGSAKTGDNVDDAFTKMAELVQISESQSKQKKLDIKEKSQEEKNKGCC